MTENKPKSDIDKCTMRYLLPTLICCSLLLSSCALPQRPVKIEVPDAQQYVLFLVNGRVMSVTARTETHENGQIITTEQQDQYRRGFFRTRRLSSVEKIVQDSDGTVLRFENEKRRGIRNDRGGFDIYSIPRNKKIKEIQISEETLFDLQVPDWLKERNPEEGDKFTAVIFGTYLLEETQWSIAVGPMKQVSILGQTGELRQLSIEMNSSMGQLRSTRYVNERWEPIKDRVKYIGLVWEQFRCAREQIPRTTTAVTMNELAAMQSPVRIRNMKSADRIRYCMKPKDGEQLSFPSTDYQKVTDQPDGTVFVEVLPMNPPKGHAFPYEGNDPEVLNALKATSVLECNDEIIMKLAKKAVGKEKDAAKAVEKIRSFAFWYLNTGYTDAYSAVEIATEKKGKCSEHAKLMAAMCRSAGIPSNVVNGYVYAGRKLDLKYAFSGHAWVEVYIGEKWYAVDPTRLTFWGKSNDHTVGHIATSVWDGDKNDPRGSMDGFGTFEIVSVQQY